MLKFEDLTSANWEKYKKFVAKSELIYERPLRESMAEYRKIISREGSVCKVAMLGSKYVGNIVGYCPTLEDITEGELKGIRENKEMILLTNVIINPEYQGRGYGARLVKDFIQSSKDAGYEKIAGYFRKNSSLHIFKKIGARQKRTYKNWQGGNEEYVLCELLL